MKQEKNDFETAANEETIDAYGNKHQGHAPDCSWHQDWHSCAGPEFCNKQKAIEPEAIDD